MRNSSAFAGNSTDHSLSDGAKRLFDIAVSIAALLITAPILVFAAILVKLNSPGPIFYRGVRVGRYGIPFRIIKFRTMVVDAELRGGSATAGDDPRITPIGGFLRHYKLDELPQFFNVLVGDMSLVGPRPAVEKYTASEKERALLALRPGITDWASIWNSHEETVLEGSTDPEKSYEELIHPIKTDLQLLYLHNHSIFTDVKILFHTFAKLISDDWCPNEIKPFGKIRTYRMLNEAQIPAHPNSVDQELKQPSSVLVGPMDSRPDNEMDVPEFEFPRATVKSTASFRAAALESQSRNKL
jgi:lipopolysaccharide/colanic/teichoic acid biosynthesis glycosyltransferase